MGVHCSGGVTNTHTRCHTNAGTDLVSNMGDIIVSDQVFETFKVCFKDGGVYPWYGEEIITIACHVVQFAIK